MDKAAIITAVSKYENDLTVSNIGQKLQEATKKALLSEPKK